MREEIKNWWRQAQRDLKTSENSFKSKDYYASAFWCQQSLEKGIKAYIMFSKRVNNLNFHSLIKLARIAKLPSEFHSFLRTMSPEYYISRYPDASEEIPFELYTKEDIKDMLKKSKDVMKWLKMKIEK